MNERAAEGVTNIYYLPKCEFYEHKHHFVPKLKQTDTMYNIALLCFTLQKSSRRRRRQGQRFHPADDFQLIHSRFVRFISRNIFNQLTYLVACDCK